MILGRKEPRGGGGNPYFFGVVFFFVGLGGFEGHFYLQLISTFFVTLLCHCFFPFFPPFSLSALFIPQLTCQGGRHSSLPTFFFPFPFHLPILSLLSFYFQFLFYFGVDENNGEVGGSCLVDYFLHCCNKKKVPKCLLRYLGVIFMFVFLLCLDGKSKKQTIRAWGKW